MSSNTEPTRFLHTPGITTTTYLITDTPEGRALAAKTPEDSAWLRTQRRLTKATKPLALLTLASMGFIAGDQLIGPRITDAAPLTGTWGIYLVTIIALAGLGAYVLSTWGRDTQHEALATNRHIAQPTRFTPDDLHRLPLTVRGTPTLTALSRAADKGLLGAIYTELDRPGQIHASEIEDALTDITRH